MVKFLGLFQKIKASLKRLKNVLSCFIHVRILLVSYFQTIFKALRVYLLSYDVIKQNKKIHVMDYCFLFENFSWIF